MDVAEGASGLAAAFGARTGRVSAFDDHVGAGTVTADDADETWFFHCTRIADGSRTIAVGTWVMFDVMPGPTGLEAVSVRRRN
jgi:cold shock CspA family protein